MSTRPLQDIKSHTTQIDDAPVYVLWEDDGAVDLVYAPFHQRLISLNPFLRGCTKSAVHRYLANFPELGKPVFTLAGISAQQPAAGLATVHLSIGLSDNCTLKCQYCHARAGLASKAIDPALLCRVIDSAYRRAVQEKNREILVTFSAGGEPTFHWRRFVSAVLYIRHKEQESGVKTGIQMTTNGYYPDRKREFIANNLTQVTLSLDGVRHVQNKQRPSCKNRDTFDEVVATARYLYQRKFPFGIRSTVTRECSAYLSEFVHFVAAEIGPVPIAFETVVPIGRAAPDSQSDCNTVFAEEQRCVTNSLWEAFLVGEKLGVPVSTSSINLRKIILQMCGAMALPSLTLTSRGRITGCHRDNAGLYSYGSINSRGELQFDADKIAEIKHLALAPLSCGSCFCRYSCGGDCPDLRINGLNRCTQTRLLTFRALEHRSRTH